MDEISALSKYREVPDAPLVRVPNDTSAILEVAPGLGNYIKAKTGYV